MDVSEVLDVICYDIYILSDGCKNYVKDWRLVILQPTFLFLTNLNLKIPLHDSPQNLFSFGTWLDTQVKEKSKISGPGKFRNLTFSIAQNWALGPKNDCHDAEMVTILC